MNYKCRSHWGAHEGGATLCFVLGSLNPDPRLASSELGRGGRPSSFAVATMPGLAPGRAQRSHVGGSRASVRMDAPSATSPCSGVGFSRPEALGLPRGSGLTEAGRAGQGCPPSPGALAWGSTDLDRCSLLSCPPRGCNQPSALLTSLALPLFTRPPGLPARPGDSRCTPAWMCTAEHGPVS